MESDDTAKGTEGSETVASILGEESLTPPTPSQDEKSNGQNEPSLPASLESAGQQPVQPASPTFSDEIRALKMKISELESQADPNLITQDPDPEGPEQETSHSQLLANMEQFKRMENCLYRHRKEWEQNAGPQSFEMYPRYHPDRFKGGPYGPWRHIWDWEHPRHYTRPDPFDPSHECTGGDGDGKDDYDYEIDFGARRERIRKNFEWDLDRLFLAEEFENRRRKKKAAAVAEQKPESVDDCKAGDEPEEKELELPTFAEPKSKRLDWLAFKRSYDVPEKNSCVIDILIGEPVINDDFGSSRGWYGYAGHRARKSSRPQDRKAPAALVSGNAPLPERIRIHSGALRRILTKILSSNEGNRADGRAPAVVFVRPFKALFYSEQALRAWCTALEKKFESADKAAQDGPTAANKSEFGNDSSRTSEGTSSQKTVEDVNLAEKIPEVASKATAMKVEDREEDQGQGGDHDDDDDQSEEDEEKEEDDPNDITKSTTALDHLKCLLGFMDSEILARQAFLNSSSCRKASFSDLWYLFRPGVEVIGSDGKQAYRVISVTSARHRVVPAWQRWFSDGKSQKAPLSVTCVYIDFDGKSLGPVSKSFDFKRFEGERDIISLEIYPLQFHPPRKIDFNDAEWKKLESLPAEKRYRQKLIDRGAKFLEAAGVKHVYYAGPTLGIRDEVESQVVVDFETAFSVEDNKQQNWKPDLEVLLGNIPPQDFEEPEEVIDDYCRADCCRGEFIYNDTYIDQKQRTEYIDSLLPKTHGMNEQPSVAIIPQLLAELKNGPDYTISDNERVIMSYRVFGFVLRSRKWAQLDLSYVTEVHPPKVPVETIQHKTSQDDKEEKKYETTFDRLVLEQGHKPMILSLIAQHFRDKQTKTGQMEQVDIVRGKGKGLILLLHGAPGVGKTSTAEGVAELFQKPLFQITCGDLGTTAREIEKALETNFALANRWDCILLLDEADVFLAERNKEDFIRNGLVAVFLRVLEYYAGILFLTTNRVGDFDEAFASRIHVSLYYPDLNNDKTIEVFKINLDMIKRRFEDRGRTIVIEDVDKFASDHFTNHPQARWNGRQIRNACQTALALAEFEAQGNSHETVLKPDALVHLKLSHFETVQKAYLEFAKYMNDVLGSNWARRAKESKFRAIWVDENDRIVATPGMGSSAMDKKAAFLLASQGHQQDRTAKPHAVPPQPQLPQLQQGSQQLAATQFHPAFQQPAFQMGTQAAANPGLQQYFQYPNIAAPQPVYPQGPSQMPALQQQQPQLYLVGQPWNNTGSNAISAPFSGQGEGQNPSLQQQLATASPSQQPQQQQQQQQLQQQQHQEMQQPTNPTWLNQNIQALYAAGGPQGLGTMPPPGSLPPDGGGYVPGHHVAG